MPAVVDLGALVRRLATRSPQAEANKQADIQTLLLYGGLNLGEGDLDVVELEAQVGGGRRIDIEVGLTAIEVKRDLRGAGVCEKAEEQLFGYVRSRTNALAQRYTGILTDGTQWYLYHLTDDSLKEVSSIELTPATADVEALSVWLEGALATVEAIAPTPREIGRRLGAGSSAHALATAELELLYAKNRDRPTVQLKRELWARLLRVAFGTNFEDDDQLFIDHTLLVVSAEVIAHAVVGIDPRTLSPGSILSGQQFAQAGDLGRHRGGLLRLGSRGTRRRGLRARFGPAAHTLRLGGRRARRHEDPLREHHHDRLAPQARRVLHARLAGGLHGR